MATTRVNLGLEPRINIHQVGGNLEVRGWERPETVVETKDDDGVTLEEGGLSIETDHHCSIRMPEGGSLVIETLDGNLRIKDLSGSVQVEQIGGSASIRRVGDLQLGNVDGHLNIRDIPGQFSFEHIGGSVSARDIAGLVSGKEVGGHFTAKGIAGGAQVDEVGGNVALRTEFRPETTYQFKAGGHIELSVPESVNARFMIEAGGSIKGESSFQVMREGRKTIFIAGGGTGSVVDLEAGGSVRIKQRSYFPSDDEYAGEFDDFSDQLEDSFGYLDAQFSSLESQLDGIPSHIRGRVSRKLDAARRKMVDAQRRVEQTMRSASRDLGSAEWSVNVNLGGSQSPSEPISEQERLLILQMLEEGKISVAEAQKLLAALEGRSG
jgi:hypothetical protein